MTVQKIFRGTLSCVVFGFVFFLAFLLGRYVVTHVPLSISHPIAYALIGITAFLFQWIGNTGKPLWRFLSSLGYTGLFICFFALANRISEFEFIGGIGRRDELITWWVPFFLSFIVQGAFDRRFDRSISGMINRGDTTGLDRALHIDPAAVNKADKHGVTPLFHAVTIGNLEVVRMLLVYSADVNASITNGLTSLHWAVATRRWAIVNELLRYDADANARDKSGSTPLHYAAGTGRAKNVSLLLEYGADVNARDMKGNTPLARASTGRLSFLPGRKKVAELLLEQGGTM